MPHIFGAFGNLWIDAVPTSGFEFCQTPEAVSKRTGEAKIYRWSRPLLIRKPGEDSIDKKSSSQSCSTLTWTTKKEQFLRLTSSSLD